MNKRLLTSGMLTAALAATSMVAAAPAFAQADDPKGVVINEVESNGDPVGDWVEIANRDSAESVDISGWSILDDDDSHDPIVFPEGTTIESGGYKSIITDKIPGGFGLGGNDSVRLFDADGEIVDETSWEGHAATTWGRIPDMTGDFAVTGAPTKDGINSAEGEEDDTETKPFPGGEFTIKDQDLGGDFADEDMSGVDFDDEGNAYVVNNGTGTLYVLTYDAEADAYSVKQTFELNYPDGAGTLDAEGVTVNPDGSIYVATERNNDDSSVSRPSLLHFELTEDEEGTLDATEEVSLKEFVGEIGANAGLEAVEYVPEIEGYAVGVEATGDVLFVTIADGKATLVDTYESPFEGVMALDYSDGVLRALCDEVCQGRSVELTFDGKKFVSDGTIFDRPAGLDNFANEGFASFTDETGTRYLWADDSVADGVSLRSAFVPAKPAGSIPDPLGSLGGDGSAENALPVLGSLAIGGVAAGIALAVSNGAIQLPQI